MNTTATLSSAPTRDSSQTHTFDRIIRATPEFLNDLLEADTVKAATLARTMLLHLVVSAAIFGIVLGTYRGGIQMVYLAIKIPVLLLGTLVLCSPAFAAFTYVFGQVSPRQTIMLALAASTRVSLVLACLGPALWIVQGQASYHGAIVAIVAASAVAGITGVMMFLRGLHRAWTKSSFVWLVAAGLSCAIGFSIMGAHNAWLLRPYLVRPQTKNVPFLRKIEGSWIGSVVRSSRSAQGIYDRETR